MGDYVIMHLRVHADLMENRLLSYSSVVQYRHVTDLNSVQALNGLRTDVVRRYFLLGNNITSSERLKQAVFDRIIRTKQPLQLLSI